jgi:hypothetical protein
MNDLEALRVVVGQEAIGFFPPQVVAEAVLDLELQYIEWVKEGQPAGVSADSTEGFPPPVVVDYVADPPDLFPN